MWQDLIKFERSLMINGRHDYRWSILKEKRYRNYWTNNLIGSNINDHWWYESFIVTNISWM